jgi:hypothetical protein
MDIEQLKLVLEMVGTATEGAMWFAFAWLAKGMFVDLVGYGLAGFITYQISQMVLKLVAPFTSLYTMRSADPAISEGDKSGEMYSRHTRVIIATHARGCEAIKAERNGQ